MHKYPNTLIIIGHTTVDISQIPPYWIEQAAWWLLGRLAGWDGVIQ